ncbi:OmpP1/FadL family transporter [Nereida sp. MMG025]|uniref:OmpP1/FadL family transporter n=1 Tax=Nereida sp. MMG025 TaxID=2909981 RepID=UPI001F419CD7|nr:outer membrane protein transport protein [Nereida sp. MMG025]MCF6443254.1 autotransporter domain-containing protein [Nereida sp. MMG025]
MKTVLSGAAALALATGAAQAGGIDRSGQFLSPLFEDGGETGAYLQFSYGQVNPEANGTVNSGAAPLGQPLGRYNSLSFAYKNELSDQLSFAVIVDQPFGVTLSYGGTFLSSNPTLEALGFEPQANISSNAVTGVLRYKFNENFSVHGGLRSQQMSGRIVSTAGILDASSNRDLGYLVGVAYERPDIAMRFALTYNSEIDHRFDAQTLNPSTGGLVPIPDFRVVTPESLNLEFQTGIAADTLLFGSVRYAKWDGFNLTAFGTSGPETEFVRFTEDTTTFSIGVGRRLNENWSVAATYGYESSGSRPGDTLLAPTTGSETFGLAATYTEGPMVLTAGVSMGRLGDQSVPLAPGQAATFEDNKVFGAGIRLGYNF